MRMTFNEFLYCAFCCFALVFVHASNADAANKALVQKGSKFSSDMASNSFDLESVPYTNAELPPFPYVDYPAHLDEGYKSNETDVKFDKAYIIVGNEMREVKGRVSFRFFPHNTVNMSALASRRNYEALVKSLGGVKINKSPLFDKAIIDQEGGDIKSVFKKLRLLYGHASVHGSGVTSYDVYLIRTKETNIWIAVSTFDDGINTSLLVIKEGAMEQIVGPTDAGTMTPDNIKEKEQSCNCSAHAK